MSKQLLAQYWPKFSNIGILLGNGWLKLNSFPSLWPSLRAFIGFFFGPDIQWSRFCGKLKRPNDMEPLCSLLGTKRERERRRVLPGFTGFFRRTGFAGRWVGQRAINGGRRFIAGSHVRLRLPRPAGRSMTLGKCFDVVRVAIRCAYPIGYSIFTSSFLHFSLSPSLYVVISSAFLHFVEVPVPERTNRRRGKRLSFHFFVVCYFPYSFRVPTSLRQGSVFNSVKLGKTR